MGLTNRFSHVSNFTGYMRVVLEELGPGNGEKLLEIPAGSGKMSDALREAGYEVTSADINKERSDFVFADMSNTLPFEDSSFDIIICLEGIEHLIDPNKLIKELSRICRVGGRVIISTPNIMNMYSRFQFLFTGTFHQFSPMDISRIENNQLFDRGHINSLTYWQLRYLFECHKFSLHNIYGDKIKRKILFPFYLLIIILGRIWLKSLLRSRNNSMFKDRKREIVRHSYSKALLFSRSLILDFKKID